MLTLNVSRYQTTLIQSELIEYFEKLQDVLRLLEDEKAVQLPAAQPHQEIDRADIEKDYTYTLRRYLTGASCIISESIEEPSMQLSPLSGSDSYDEARTSYPAFTKTSLQRYIKVFIRGLPETKTILVQVDIHNTINDLRDLILLTLERLKLSNATFALTHGNRVLSTLSWTIRDYNISQLSTLRCVSFGIGRSLNVACFRKLGIEMNFDSARGLTVKRCYLPL